MTQTFNQDVFIDGASDAKQLRVQGHTTQTQPLQTWETSAGSVQGQMTGDGRLALGDDLGVATPDALLEVHRADTSTAKPKRGFHSLGRVAGALSDAVTWVVQELELLGSGAISAVQTALRVRLTHDNSATSSSAELRGADVEVIQKQGTVNILTALRAAVTRQAGTVTTAYGVKVEDVEGATNNYALHTGKGLARFGDALELKTPASIPGAAPTDTVRVYAKNDGKLYLKDSAGTETEVGTGSGNSPRICDGRLTLTSGAPVTTTDVSGASTAYFAPYNGNQIALFDGTRWKTLTFTQLTIPIGSLDRHRLYDVFLYDNGGTLNYELSGWNAPASGAITAITNVSPPVVTSNGHGLSNDQIVTIYGVGGATGTNSTWRVASVAANTFTLKTLNNGNPAAPGVYTSGGTWVRADANSGGRATTVALVEGVYVKSGDATRRYVGTIRITDQQGQTEDSARRRYVWNAQQRVERRMEMRDPAASWTYATAAWRPINNNLSDRLECVVGLIQEPIHLTYSNRNIGSFTNTHIGIALNRLNGNDGQNMAYLAGGGEAGSAEFHKLPLEGYQYYQPVEYVGGGTAIYVGASASVPNEQYAMLGKVMA